jgi:DNA repair protein RecN (Recombination protein N)
LEAELGLLSNAEQMSQALYNLTGVLDANDQPVTRQLKSLAQQMEGVARFHPALQALADRLRSAQVELKDIADEAEHISEGISMDVKRLNEVNERLSIGYKLLKKHNVKDTQALLVVQKQIGEKIQRVMNVDEEIAKAKTEHDQALQTAREQAGRISGGRISVVKDLEAKVGFLLQRVGMPNAKIKIELESGELNNMGSDRVEFLFDANKTGRFEPLRKVASGGEFSRLLLCIKTLVAGSLAMPLMIFDEIDTGISGEAAKQVGILMKEMGHSHQIISITHQPQIAARADAHYFVYKKEVSGAIRTQLRRLNDEERVESIARMMSGEKPSASALQNARELMTAN